MKDFYKSDVLVGDKVVCMVKDYRSLIEATVIKVTAQTVLVEYQANWIARDYNLTYRVKSDQFIVVDSSYR